MNVPIEGGSEKLVLKWDLLLSGRLARDGLR